MRIPLNKALAPNTKEGKTLSTVGTYPGKADSMNKELKKVIIKKVMDVAAELIKAQPENRAQYLKGIADAQAAQKAAAQAKEDAETEAAFNKACDDESHARDKEAFFKRQLERLDYTPRMEEATYYKHVDAVKATVEKAAADFRRVAEKAIDDIAAAKAAYIEITNDADAALIALDEAANVLQSKYRYKEHYVTGEGGKGRVLAGKTEDRNEWTFHAIRYTGNGKGYDLIAKDGADWNKKTCAAWEAARKAGKDF